MSDWEDGDRAEAESQKVVTSTFVRSRKKEKTQSTCPTCSRSGPCKCPQVLPGTRHRASNEGGRARRSNPITCYGCKEEGHALRNCPNSSRNSGTVKRGKHGKSENHAAEKDYTPKEENLEDLFDLKLGTGINFQNYDRVKVEVTPAESAPSPLNQFKDAPFSSVLLQNILRCGYERPTPVQKHAIPIILNKRDVMSCAQTGSGKTAAFLLPIIHSLLQKNGTASNPEIASPRALILGPTRELVVQIKNEARKFCSNLGIRCKVVYGGTSVKNSQTYLLDGHTDILSATPGRLLDLMERELVSFEKLEFLVLDEADRMLDMGFRSIIDDIFRHFSMPGKEKRQTLLFSATFPPEIQMLSSEYLRDYLFLKVGIVGGACEDIEQIIHKVKDYEKMERLLITIKEYEAKDEGKILVFARKKKGVDFLATRLCLEGHPATSIHGDRLQRQREEALDDFKKGVRPILVATEVAARGLDIPKVSMVINYDLPVDISTYVHRIGRSGRVGNKGKAISFYEADNDRPLAKGLVDVLKSANQKVPEWLEKQGDAYYGGERGSRNGKTNFNSDIRKKNKTQNTAELFNAQTEEEYWE